MQPTPYIQASATDPSSQDEFSKLFRLLLRNSGLEEDDVSELDVEDDPLKTEFDVDEEYQPLEHGNEITHSTNEDDPLSTRGAVNTRTVPPSTEETRNDLHGFRITDIGQILRCHFNSGKKVSVPVDQASHSRRNGQLVLLRPVFHQLSGVKQTTSEEYLLPHPFAEGDTNTVDLKCDYDSGGKSEAAKTKMCNMRRRAGSLLRSSSVVIPSLAEKQISSSEEYSRDYFGKFETNRIELSKNSSTTDDLTARAASVVNAKRSCEKLSPRPSASIHFLKKILNIQSDKSSSHHLFAASDLKSLRHAELTRNDNITGCSSSEKTSSVDDESFRKHILEDRLLHQVPNSTASCFVSRNDSSVCNPSDKLRAIKVQNWMKSACENEQLRTMRIQNWMRSAREKEPVLEVTSSANSSCSAFSFQNFRKDAIEDFKKRIQNNLEKARTASQSNNVNVFIIRNPPVRKAVEICRRSNTKHNESNQDSKMQLFDNNYSDRDTNTRTTGVLPCNTSGPSAVEDENFRQSVSVSHGEESLPGANDRHSVEDYETVYVYPDPSLTERQHAESRSQVPSETNSETSSTSDSEHHADNHCEAPETDPETRSTSNPVQYVDNDCKAPSETDMEIRTLGTEPLADNHGEALSKTDVEMSKTANFEGFTSLGKCVTENPDSCEKLEADEGLDLYEIQMQLLVDSPPAAEENMAVGNVPEYYVERAARLHERKKATERRKNQVLAMSEDGITPNDLAELCEDMQTPQLLDIFVAEEECNPSESGDHSYAVVSSTENNEENTRTDVCNVTDSEPELSIETLFLCPLLCTSRIFKTVKGLKRHLSTHRNHKDGAPPAKRVPRFRTRIIGAERSQLCYFFEHTPYPSVSAKRELASRLNLDYSKVRSWFRNRRAFLRKSGRPGEVVASRSHAEKHRRDGCNSSADAKDTLFLCASCQISFSSEENLDTHLATHNHKKKMKPSVSDVAYACATCKRTFAKKRDLRKHVSVHIGVDAGTNDGDADSKNEVQLDFDYYDEAFSPSVTAKDSSGYLEPSIGSGIPSSDETSSYLADASKPFAENDATSSSHASVERKNLQPNQTEPSEECLFCAKTFAGKDALREHFISTRSICCNQATPSVDVVRRYSAKHCNAESYWCSTCGESYTSKKSLKTHVLSHSTNRTFSCDFCGRRCSSEVSLERHIRAHSKSFVCAHCDNVFLQKCKLREHVLSAMSAVPFVCPEADCRQSFTNKCSLTRHVLLHGGDKSYEYAARGLSRPSEPARLEHASQEDPIKRRVLIRDSDSWLSCFHCDRSFSRKDKLKSHIVKMHGLGC